MKSIQRDCNVRVTKSVYLLNSSTLIFEGDGVLEGRDIESLREELRSPDSVLILPKDSKFEISSNAQMGEEQLKIIELYLNLIQRVTGINDEMLGIQTNATSGVAQNIRQVNSVRNNVFAFDDFAEMKKREAKFMLDMIQSGYDENIAVQVLTDQQNYWLVLNLSHESDKGVEIYNDVRTLPLSLYIEEVPDYRSTSEERQAKLEALLNNQNAPLIAMSPTLLKDMGIREGEKISQEIREAMQQKMMMEQGIMQGGQNSQGQLPPPDQMPMSPDQIVQGGI